jgi:hypothetical protein
MTDHPSQFVRSATHAGIIFTIQDLEIAISLLDAALQTTDVAAAERSRDHAARTLTETRELMTRAAPTNEQRERLIQLMQTLEERLATFGKPRT